VLIVRTDRLTIAAQTGGESKGLVPGQRTGGTEESGVCMERGDALPHASEIISGRSPGVARSTASRRRNPAACRRAASSLS